MGTQTNDDRLSSIEDVFGELRDRRKVLARKVGNGDDFEAEALFSTAERKWRRIEPKIEEAREQGARDSPRSPSGSKPERSSRKSKELRDFEREYAGMNGSTGQIVTRVG